MDNDPSTFDNQIDHASGQESIGMRDTEYYFSTVVVKVENTIFRVPRNGFNVPGTILADRFSLPIGDNGEGSSDRNPIVLLVSEKYFRGFLRVMYAINGRQLTGKDWLGALDLSTMWGFSDIRRRAIRALDYWIQKRDAKAAVFLAKKYRIANWLTGAYTRVLQEQVFTTSELTASPYSLDWETIARLFSVREAVGLTNSYGSSRPNTCPTCLRSRLHSLRSVSSSYSGKTICRCGSGTLQAEVSSPSAESLKIAIEKEFNREIAGMKE